MCVSDLLIVKKYILSQVAIGIVVGTIMAIVMESVYVIIPALCIMIPYSLAFTAIAFDERNGWEEFRLALPLSRKDVIRGRYASFAIITLASLVLSLIVMGIVAVVAAALAPVIGVSNLITDISWQIILADAIAGLGFVTIMLAVILPLIARFGMTKAVRVIPVVIICGVLGFFMGGENLLSEIIGPLIEWLITPAGTGIMALISLIVLTVVYVASCVISTKLYESRG